MPQTVLFNEVCHKVSFQRERERERESNVFTTRCIIARNSNMKIPCCNQMPNIDKRKLKIKFLLFILVYTKVNCTVAEV